MNDFPHSASDLARKEGERQLENYKAKQAEQRTQQRHDEMIKTQTDLVESNNRLTDEVHGICDSLQTQIDDNRITEEKHDKRSKREFRISLAVAIGSALFTLIGVVISAVALYFSINK